MPTTTALGPCIEWEGARYRSGHGRKFYEGRVWGVHRLAWFLIHGPIAPGLCVLHKCDNPPCYRLDHLYEGTKKDNAQDRARRGRSAPTHGEANGRAVLTADDVRTIRALHASGELTQAAIGKMYGINQSRVSSIALRRTWKEVV